MPWPPYQLEITDTYESMNMYGFHEDFMVYDDAQNQVKPGLGGRPALRGFPDGRVSVKQILAMESVT